MRIVVAALCALAALPRHVAGGGGHWNHGDSRYGGARPNAGGRPMVPPPPVQRTSPADTRSYPRSHAPQRPVTPAGWNGERDRNGYPVEIGGYYASMTNADRDRARDRIRGGAFDNNGGGGNHGGNPRSTNSPMLKVPCEVEGEYLEAFVDTGAQVSEA